LPIERLDEVVAGIARALSSGARAYWICPLVEESETLDVAAAEDRAAALRTLFGDTVGLVHGKMASAERDAAMERFQRGETRILVATTVVEVGVDVPEATIMIVEHAERFGLAQLHQLRGRVGRGAGRSTCLLIYKGPLSEAARARLETLRETEDGFRIAEEDLKLRGEGDVLGARQAGAPGFRFARLEIHGGLLDRAREEAEAALDRDERLAAEGNRGLRLLLHLFERGHAARLLEAG
jgi:ATP-dependent DNA helicase RecG